MRVFCLSGLIDRMSDRLYVHTINLSGSLGFIVHNICKTQAKQAS